MNDLSRSEREALFAMTDGQRRSVNGRVLLSVLARSADLSANECLHAAQLLAQRGFVQLVQSPSGTGVMLTDSGRTASRAVGVLEPRGRVEEYARDLTHLQATIVDCVVDWQLRIAGSSASRSQIRTTIRDQISPRPNIAVMTKAIDDLAPAFLVPLGGAEFSYRANLRGLLASNWGLNAIEALDGTLRALAQWKRDDPALMRYSWRRLREHLGLPAYALNFAYLVISEAKLGAGLFESEDERWWATPPDLDILLEVPDGLSYARSLLAAEPAAVAAPTERQQLVLFDTEVDLNEDTSTPIAEGEIRDPFDPNKIRVRLWTPTVYNVMERLAHGELDIAPEFQRRAGVWNDQKQSRLLESILMRIPLPAFYLDELPLLPSDLTERYAVVDGVQRLYVLDRFINKKDLALHGLEFLQLEGRTFTDLQPPLQRRILETQLTVNVVESGTPVEAKLNIFKRINTGGVPLTAQEIRHAMSPQASRQWLRQIAESLEFRSAVGATAAEAMALRMQDRECATRFFAFIDEGVEAYRNADTDFDAFLLSVMKRLPGPNAQNLEQRFRRAMVAAQKCFGPVAFRKASASKTTRGPVNKALFETIAVNLDQRSDDELHVLSGRSNQIIKLYIEALADKQISDSVSVATGDPRRVEVRFSAIRRVLEEALHAQ